MKYYFLLLTFLLVSCAEKDIEVIADIPEASGICYSGTTDTLFVANDEGKIYEISTSGKILRQKKLGKYDLEGVACDDAKKQLYFVLEGKDNLLIVDQNTLQVLKEINVERTYRGKKLLVKDKEHGLEGIAIGEDKIYLANQSKNPYPKDDPSIIVVIDKYNDKEAKIETVIDPHRKDIAGLSFYKGYFYMVSDKEDLLIKYDLKKAKTVWVRKLPKFSQEGITFDNEGMMYLADDEGRVLKYRMDDLEAF
ncbi:MAG: SdiA-regulated domain-containing protein [Sulfurovum sp.]|jgi:uncharacterized protein YjiK|nr:SdiA-regulated domain-containing protein [Sulfurovum sp.]